MKLPCKTFREFLELKHLLNASDEVIANAKAEWKQLYAKVYWANYKKVQFSLVLNTALSEYIDDKGVENSMKSTEYVIHLIEQDKEGESLPPYLIIDIEVGLLRILDHVSKEVSKLPELRGHFAAIIEQIETLLNCIEV